MSKSAIQRCSLPQASKFGGHVARCPDCGQWWRERFHGSAYFDDCYSSWERIGWLRLHTQYRAQYKHWKEAVR